MDCEPRNDTLSIDEPEQDLIHDLGRRLTCLWSYDRCIAMASGQTELLQFWRLAKSREQENIDRLKTMIEQYFEDDSPTPRPRYS